MLLVTDEDGQFISEMEISNNIIGLLVASYETTGTAVTFVLKHLAELPHIYKEVYRGIEQKFVQVNYLINIYDFLKLFIHMTILLDDHRDDGNCKDKRAK